MGQDRRNRCDEIIDLIDRCLAEYESTSRSQQSSPAGDRRR
jgi:hypothetical protein